MNRELAKIDLELRHERNAAEFDARFNLVHIPTIDRLQKVDGKYAVYPCGCYFCQLGRVELWDELND